jgi:signal peptidase II
MSRSMDGRGLYLWVTALVVVLDQGTKTLVDRLMSLHESHLVLDGLLRLTYVRNRGAAFGILSEAELPYQSLLFSGVSLVALFAIAIYAWRLPSRSWLPRLALTLIMGGAVGNLLDRARLGYVIDFVDVFWGAHHWPAFNVADSAITIGVALLVLDMLRDHGPETSAELPGVRRAAAPAPSGMAAPSSGSAE